MVKRIAAGSLAFLLMVAVACSENKVQLPVTTSAGNLIRIEEKQSVQTSDGVLESTSEQSVYLLSFEGKQEFAYEGKDEAEGPKSLLLIDSRGRSFAPKFAGTPTRDGVISNKEWLLSGELKGRDGKWVFVGKESLPEPRMALVYLVPKDASGLTLKDGERRHAIR